MLLLILYNIRWKLRPRNDAWAGRSFAGAIEAYNQDGENPPTYRQQLD